MLGLELVAGSVAGALDVVAIVFVVGADVVLGLVVAVDKFKFYHDRFCYSPIALPLFSILYVKHKRTC